MKTLLTMTICLMLLPRAWAVDYLRQRELSQAQQAKLEAGCETARAKALAEMTKHEVESCMRSEHKSKDACVQKVDEAGTINARRLRFLPECVKAEQSLDK
jgi:hypothetical protein